MKTIRISQEDLGSLFELAMLPYETGYTLRFEENGPYLDYVDIVCVETEGKKFSSPRSSFSILNKLRDILNENEDKKYFFVDGHVHPVPPGELILPYNCGWTIQRTKEKRNYLYQKLQETDEGRKYLTERKEILGELTQETSIDKKINLKEKLIDLSPEVCVANLINIGGIDCYITNS